MRQRSLNHVLADDVLFVHAPSGIWASNHEVAAATANLAGGQGSLAEIIQAMGGPNAYQQGSAGYELSQGTLNLGGALCSTRLFFNALDHDGFNQNNSDGPTWSVSGTNGCPFDDPGSSGSLGTAFYGPQTAYGLEYQGLQPAVGFGLAHESNAGPRGSGSNYN